ncbi:efflux RND transporter periplasmic adaptor subunit [Rhizobium leguminosarum]|uniref:efflux RND transporter periplasmic adaptor subunit n=1 Tax=Rhizobium leguminosarum TaxID=384 RepID=UPI001C96DDE4|nr:efflux RND transporter periplasmic adaptor subunit [Rhizobium leguminosarum]MBY5406442.1 efflux RND transporter periplasmic adaptor subunit [Rhizobium leguminosarum]
MRTNALIGSVAAVAFLVSGCSDEEQAAKDPRPIRGIAVKSELLGETFSQTGEIRPRYETPMSFRLDGLLVSRADNGSEVKAGEVIASIDKTPSLNNVASAKAQLDAATSDVSIADLTAKRNWDLFSKNAISLAQVQQGDANLQAAKAKLQVASASLTNAEQALSYADLKAGRDGIISGVSANVGQVVSAGQTILTLSSNAELDAVFDVPEQLLNQDLADSNVDISLISDRATSTAGKVREVTPMADSATRTYRVKIALQARSDQFPLGAAVNGRVVLSPKHVFKVPAPALAKVGGKQAVFVYDVKQKSLVLRPVKIERYADRDMFISDGLADGEIVATAGVSKLREGEAVTVEEDARP